jgi:hypothetical protein
VISPQRRILETGIGVHMNACHQLTCATYGRTIFAGAGTDHVDVSGFGSAFVTEAVFVRHRAFADVGDDFHVGVRVRLIGPESARATMGAKAPRGYDERRAPRSGARMPGVLRPGAKAPIMTGLGRHQSIPMGARRRDALAGCSAGERRCQTDH